MKVAPNICSVWFVIHVRSGMRNNELLKPFLINERISYGILTVLFAVRLLDFELPGWIFGTRIPGWYAYWYVGLAYILTVLIVWLNRHRLSTLNIDRPFLIAVILGGILYVFYLPTNIGLLVGITTLLVIWAYFNDSFSFPDTIHYPSWTVPLVCISAAPVILYAMFFSPILKSNLNIQILYTCILQAQLAAVVFEEVIFRGVLWTVLRNLGLKEIMAYFISSLLFWMAHYRYLLQGSAYSFWFAIPLLAFLFGFMAWRTKSLTPGTIGHFLFNFLVALYSSVF
jgi:membrane protease YdiL (CAAX protease family)